MAPEWLRGDDGWQVEGWGLADAMMKRLPECDPDQGAPGATREDVRQRGGCMEVRGDGVDRLGEEVAPSWRTERWRGHGLGGVMGAVGVKIKKV